MPLTKKTFLLLAISSAFLALASLLHQVETARSRALEEQKRELAGAAQQLTQLTRDIGRYEAARGQLGQSGGAIARHEKVSLSSSFSPAELPRLNDLLTHAYETDGFLLLRNFSLQWTENDGGATAPSQATLSLNLTGEKVFTR